MCLGPDPCGCVRGCTPVTGGVSHPAEATDPVLQNTVNHVSAVVYCREGGTV